MQLAHANEAQVGEVWVAVRIAPGEGRELRQVVVHVERHGHQPFLHHVEDQACAAQVIGRFGQDGLAG